MFRATDISQWSIILHNIFLELHPEYFWPVIDSFRLVFALIAFALISHWLPYTWQRRMTAILSRSGVVWPVDSLPGKLYYSQGSWLCLDMV